MHSSQEQETSKWLDNRRLKLLDLTKRNSLINFKFKSRRVLCFTNGSIEKIYELIDGNTPLVLSALPELPLDKTPADFGLSTDLALPFKEPDLDKAEIDLLKTINKNISTKNIKIRKNECLIDDFDIKQSLDVTNSKDLALLLSIQTKIAPNCSSPDNFFRGVYSSYINLEYFFSFTPKKFRLRTSLDEKHFFAKVAKIYREEQTLEQEKGTPFLYLVLGFLNWKESDISSVELKSPLFAVPVVINRSKKDGSFVFDIQKGADEIKVNLSLKEKIRYCYNVEIPDIDSGEKPLDYFEKLKKHLEHFICDKGWFISSEVALSILDFSKLVMYRDLDPQLWEPNHRLSDHPVIRSLIGFSDESLDGESESTTYSGNREYSINDLIDSAKHLNLVESADITQIKAIIDVLKTQQSYIIKGPPGTGKSQTITNLIALALFEGKKVLFVSEKRAALEVVKSKLDKIGLGEFCLELHSEKVTKEKVVQGIYSALNNANLHNISNNTKSYSPDEYHKLFDQYSCIENNLDEYVNTLHSKWGKIGKSIYDILNKTVYLRLNCGTNGTSNKLIDFSPREYTSEIETKIISSLNDFLKILDNIEKRTQGNLPILEHPWKGTNITVSTPSRIELIYSALLNWQNQLDFLHNEINKIDGFNTECSLSDIGKLSEILKNYSIDFSKVDFDLLKKLSNKNFECKLIAVLRAVTNAKKLFSDITRNNDISDSFYQKLKNQTQCDMYESDTEVEQCIFPDEVTILDLSQLYNDIFEDNKYLNNCYKVIENLFQVNNNSSKTSVYYSIQFGNTIADFIELTTLLPDQAIPFRKVLCNYEKKKIYGIIDSIKQYISSLGAVSTVINTNSSTTLDDLNHSCEIYMNRIFFISLFNSSYRAAVKKLKNLSANGNPKEIINNFDAISKYYQDLSCVTDDHAYISILNDYDRATRSPQQILDILESLLSWDKMIAKKLGPLFSDNSDLKKLLITIDDFEFRDLKKESQTDYATLRNKICNLKNIKNKYIDFFNHLPFSENEVGDASELEKASNSIKNILLKLQSIFKNPNVNLNYCKSSIKKIKQLQDSCKQIYDNLPWLKEEIIPKDKNWNGYFDELPNIDQIIETQKQKNQFEPLNAIGVVNTNTNSKEQLQSLVSGLYTIIECYNNSMSSADIFFKEINSNAKNWGVDFGQSLKIAIIRNNEAILNKESLTDFISLTMALKNMDDLGIKNYGVAVCENKIDKKNLKNIVLLDIYNAMVEEIYSDKHIISAVSGSQLDNFRKSYAELDQKLLQTRRAYIKNKLYQYQLDAVSDRNNNRKTGTKVGDLVEIPLIQKEGQKIKRHIALRQLFNRAPNTIVGLKPCFMMSPLAVANYIEPGVINFDLLIMDEASQVKPADALGAIARAKQFVIVGDEKQMPPSNYFESNLESDEENEDDKDIIEGNESILEAGLSAGLPTNVLKWHYRSRHESLIYFSNKYFYGNQLIVFPSPKKDTSDYGIKFEYIENGYFSEGKNVIEAKRIVDATIEQILNHPDESLAIVAMNKEQSSLIDEILTEEILNNVKAEVAWSKISESKEPLLIKNLETIQGDERDVVFISCTYGKDPVAKKVYQRFGPINSQGGERRLNVLFSRAKKRMHVFSSMLPEDIMQSKSKGTQLFKDFLYYAKNGIERTVGDITGKEPDSDFEIAVAQLLTSYGYECEPQVGVQGYFIDIAIKDPVHSGEYIMGIECDGATYHGSAFARDRDCLRQQILENLGWRIRRIWSTDWFKNPKGTLKPILDELAILTNTQ